MDRRGERVAGDLARTATSWAAAAELPGVARGGERQGRDTRARGDKRRDDPEAHSGSLAHHGKVCTDSRPNLGRRHFLVERVDTPCAAERRRPAAAFRESLSWSKPRLRCPPLRTSRYPPPLDGCISKERACKMGIAQVVE